MVIDLGESQILERHVPETIQCVGRIAGAGGYFFEKVFQFLLIHVFGE